MKRIGLLGGSFDPPHKGHIYISLEAKKILKLDEIWWLVTPKNPLKINKPATYKERIINCKNLTQGKPIFIKEIEKKINSKYTYQTLEYLLNHYKNIKFFWIMGADNLVNFHKWQNWNKILNEISVVVFRRRGYNSNALKSISYKKFFSFLISQPYQRNKFNKLPSWTIFNNKEIKISSTEIREQRLLLRGKN